jgi:hypothetical protein
VNDEISEAAEQYFKVGDYDWQPRQSEEAN